MPARWIALISLAGAMLAGCSVPGSASADAAHLPDPRLDPAPSRPGEQVAVFAGGCFWGVEAVFDHVRGVREAWSGYSGGAADTATYEQVSDGDTGHAESVQITFDPRQVTFAQLLQIYFSVAHDPTELNRQGPDEGTQYRSAIFAASPLQDQIARAYIAQLDSAHVFPAAIATKIEPLKAFYPAEDYHQDYLVKNPRASYIVVNDLPKIAALKRVWPDFYREKPVLLAER